MSWAELRRLGADVEAAWRAVNYDAEAFPAISAERLGSAVLDGEIPFAEIIERLTDAETALLQEPELGFSDLPLVVFRGAFFRLQVLLWTSGSMAVHQHPFSGAFRVLAGSSIAATFRLQTVRRVSHQLALVKADTQELEILKPGACRRILPGAGLTHAVYHCGVPSITIVARSHHAPWTADDQVLFRPGVLLDARLDDDPTLRMLDRTLSMIADARSTELAARIGQALERLDPARIAWLVRRFSVRLGEGWSDILEPVRTRHPDLVDGLLGAVQDMQARSLVRRARAIATDEDVRFLLAAMLVATTRADVYALVGRRGEPGDAQARTHAILQNAPPMVLYPWQHMLR